MIKKINVVDIFRVIKYLFTSGSSFIIDLGVFNIFNSFLKNIFLSTIIARSVSSFYNYLLNSRMVFKSYSKNSIFKYYTLVIIQMLISATVVFILNNLFVKINTTVIKFFVDIIIFIVNYFVQKEIVFK